jgi:hypothetical protein
VLAKAADDTGADIREFSAYDLAVSAAEDKADRLPGRSSAFISSGLPVGRGDQRLSQDRRSLPSDGNPPRLTERWPEAAPMACRLR